MPTSENRTSTGVAGPNLTCTEWTDDVHRVQEAGGESYADAEAHSATASEYESLLRRGR
jgi:hypothetical protein